MANHVYTFCVHFHLDTLKSFYDVHYNIGWLIFLSEEREVTFIVFLFSYLYMSFMKFNILAIVQKVSFAESLFVFFFERFQPKKTPLQAIIIGNSEVTAISRSIATTI